MKIQPIVEGHSEVSSVPVLLRRLRDESGDYSFDVGSPIRRPRSQLVLEQPLRQSVKLALLQPECGAILILFDGDDDCPAQLGPLVQTWAQDEAGQVPCAVVVAQREYESWFLAALPAAPTGAETIRDAKGELARLRGKSDYISVVHQASISATFDMAKAHTASRSFRRMVKAFGLLATGMGVDLPTWPPHGW